MPPAFSAKKPSATSVSWRLGLAFPRHWRPFVPSRHWICVPSCAALVRWFGLGFHLMLLLSSLAALIYPEGNRLSGEGCGHYVVMVCLLVIICYSGPLCFRDGGRGSPSSETMLRFGFLLLFAFLCHPRVVTS